MDNPPSSSSGPNTSARSLASTRRLRKSSSPCTTYRGSGSFLMPVSRKGIASICRLFYGEGRSAARCSDLTSGGPDVDDLCFRLRQIHFDEIWRDRGADVAGAIDRLDAQVKLIRHLRLVRHRPNMP